MAIGRTSGHNFAGLQGFLVVFALLGLAGCGGSSGNELAGVRQSAFRVRSEVETPLNEDADWAGALDEDVSVSADQPFRIRFEVESETVADSLFFRLQYRQNGGEWKDVEVSDFPYPDAASPRVSIDEVGSYGHGDGTTDLLSGSEMPFGGGAGINLRETSPVWSGNGFHSEWEWPLVIRRFADGAVTNDDGDVFAFRMVLPDGSPLESSGRPALTLEVPSGHLGGTFVETPGRIGPWQTSNGDLYFIMEPAETDNVLMVVKSTDGGASWEEVDGANRPAADDLEGLASAFDGTTIHILHQTSDYVWYHTFRTSEDPEAPDTWRVRDELVAEPGEPPVQVATIAARPDGTLVAVYGGPEKIRLRMRSPEGVWNEEAIVDAGQAPNLSGPMVVSGTGNVVHLAYTGSDGTAWYRRIRPDGTLSPRELLAQGLGTSENDVGSVLPLVFIPETNTVVVLYRLAIGQIWERRVTGDGPLTPPVPVSDRVVAQNPVDSDQTAADAIAVGTTVHVLFIEDGSGSIYHTSRAAGGDWTDAQPVLEGINGQWIRGTLLEGAGGGSVYGFVYDAGSDGGSGMNRYGQLSIPDLLQISAGT